MEPPARVFHQGPLPCEAARMTVCSTAVRTVCHRASARRQHWVGSRSGLKTENRLPGSIALQSTQDGLRLQRLGSPCRTKVSRPPKAGRLDCTVRPRSQHGKPQLDDGCCPRKSAVPRKRRSAARMIAGSACYTGARGPKGLKPTKRTQAKPGKAPKTQRRNLG